MHDLGRRHPRLCECTRQRFDKTPSFQDNIVQKATLEPPGKQSPRMRQQHFASVAASLGFERLKSDSNLYFQPERRCYMLCYVDDLLIFGDKKTTEF